MPDDTTNTELPIATGAETIAGDSLQPSIDALRAMATALGAQIAFADDTDDIQALGRAQNDLTSQALKLVGAQIKLLAGQAAVSATHINGAVVYAKDAIDAVEDVKKKIVAAGKVIDFVAACLTGDGGKIVETAVKLKDVL